MIGDGELTHTNSGDGDDRWKATYLTALGPLDGNGIPEFLEIELWQGESLYEAPKKLQTIKYTIYGRR